MESAVVVEQPRARVSVEIETMARGPAKVTVRVDGDTTEEAAREALATYQSTVRELYKFEAELEKKT